MGGTLIGSGRTGVAETRVPPITNLKEDQCQDGGSHEVLVVGDGGGSRELGTQGASQLVFERSGKVSKKKNLS